MSFWTGDGNANDLMGTNHGTLRSNATASAVGMVGSCFSFDGTNNFVQIADSPSLRPTNFTVEAWVWFDGFTSAGNAGGEQYIIFKQNTRSDSFEGLALQMVPNASSLPVFHFVVIGSNGPPSAKIDSVTTLTTNTWYHVACVRGATNLQLYVNGNLEGQTSVTFPQSYGSLPLYFGTTGQSFYDGKFKGRLDEVGLYNRALSATEIAGIFNAGAFGKCRPMVNDNFANRTTVLGSNIVVLANNTAATREAGEPSHFSIPASNSIWYSWTAPGPGGLSVGLSGTDFGIIDAIVAIYTGGSLATLTRVVSNSTDQANALAVCSVTSNQTYQIVLDGPNPGNITMALGFTPPPTNDLFANPYPIAGTWYETNGSFVGASRETGEPAHGDATLGQSLWWSWTAPTNGVSTLPVRLMADGVSFPPGIGVYTGNAVGSLSLVTTNRVTNGMSSELTFTATPGTTYRIALAGKESDPNSSDPLVGYYRFRLNCRVLALSVTNVALTTNADSSVAFQAQARITNFGLVASHPLRLRLTAIDGYSSRKASYADTFVSTVTELALIPLSPATLTPSQTASLNFSNTVPATDNSVGPGFGIVAASGAYAELQEQTFGTNYATVDQTLIAFDNWPSINGAPGPGGGVIRLDPAYIGLSPFNPLTNVMMVGPTLVTEGASANYSAIATYYSGTNITFTNAGWTATRPAITTNGVFSPAAVTSNTVVTITVPATYAGIDFSRSNNVTVSNLPPPNFTSFRRLTSSNFVLTLNGVPSRSHVIEAATNLAPPIAWTPLITNATATNGQLNFTNAPGSLNRRFYRAREFP